MYNDMKVPYDILKKYMKSPQFWDFWVLIC